MVQLNLARFSSLHRGILHVFSIGHRGGIRGAFGNRMAVVQIAHTEITVWLRYLALYVRRNSAWARL